MASATIKSAMLNGIEVIPVNVEVSVDRGLPSLQILGLPDAMVLEGKERIRAAIRAAGFTMPNGTVLVNLGPASLKKHGSGFDLAIAAGILVATGQIPPAHAEKRFVGELSLDGTVLPVRGAACFANYAQRSGCEVVMSANTALEGEDWDGSALGLVSIADLKFAAFAPLHRTPELDGRHLDFADIAGQENPKRACQVAAAGKLGLLLVGAPGAGKSMLAARIPSIMPAMSEIEQSECAQIRSACGADVSKAASDARPFRAPHHSATAAGIIGGGNPVIPGEVTLAHNGVLFLENIAEFSPRILQSLRQPIEDGTVRIARADGLTELPAEFLLVASANPCPCGYFGSNMECTCSAEHVRRYQHRLCGPIGCKLHMSVDMVDERLSYDGSVSSDALRAGVELAWEFRQWRERRGDSAHDANAILQSCRISDADRKHIEQHASSCGMSGRSIVSTLLVARAIADIAQSESVTSDHLIEAMSLRNAYAG